MPPALRCAWGKSFPTERLPWSRGMDVDDDIQFDFFEDEAATTEAAAGSGARLRRPPRPKPRVGRPRAGGAPARAAAPPPLRAFPRLSLRPPRPPFHCASS